MNESQHIAECRFCRKRPPYCRCRRAAVTAAARAEKQRRWNRIGKRFLNHTVAGPMGEVESKIIADLEWLHERDPHHQSEAMSGAKYAMGKCLKWLREAARKQN